MSRESTWIFWVQLLRSEALHTLRSVQEKSAPKQMQSGTDMNKTNGRQNHPAGTHGKDQNVNLKNPKQTHT